MCTCCNSGACVDAIFMLLEFVTHDNRPSDHRWISSFSLWICERCTFTVDDAEVGICYSSHVVKKTRIREKFPTIWEDCLEFSLLILGSNGQNGPRKKSDNPTSLLLVESSSWYCLMVYWNPARVEHRRMERWIIFGIHWLFLMRCGLVSCLFIYLFCISLISVRRLVPVPHLNLGCWYVGSHFVGYGYDDSKLLRFYGIRFRWYVASTPLPGGQNILCIYKGCQMVPKRCQFILP